MDYIRQTIIDRAAQLGLSAYAIGYQCKIDPGTIKRYFNGKNSISSEKVSAICGVLGLELKARPVKAKPVPINQG